GMAAIAALMFTQIPNEVSDLSKLSSLSSANSIAKNIAGLLSTAAIAPGNIVLHYNLPKVGTYDVSAQNNWVMLNATYEEQEIRVENSSSKTLIPISVQLENVASLDISKQVQGGKNIYKVRKNE
ncbi:MAG: hypothetical protein QXO27_04500, partial [Candidatus Aenigmatarchaeota archaeon]